MRAGNINVITGDSGGSGGTVRYPNEDVDGTRTVFTFSLAPPAHSLIYVNGVANDVSDYTVAGSQVTLPFAPTGLFGYW